jgi:hypothetical protein
MTPAEVAEASEGCPREMLCHESHCLDGTEPDSLCAGFRFNVEALAD